jgi:Tol biopolymer transport system component/DNA-binding winged helix-turn-helix (wHTH) protein
MNGNRPDRVQFGPFEADLHTHELWKYGTRIKLVGQPFEVLAILLSKPGELVTRDALRERLWPGDTFVDFNHGLNAAVNKLREALSDSADAPRYVETLPRRGYRFITPVSRVEVTPPIPEPTVEQPALVLPAEPVHSLAFETTHKAEPEASPCRNWRPYYLAAGVLAALLLGLFLFKRVTSVAGGREGFSSAQRVQPLTSLTAETSEPSFSSDGNYVAFRSEGTKPQEAGIFVKAVGADQLEQLTRNPGDCCPVWSPDGRTIAFSRFADKTFQMYTVPAPRPQNGTYSRSHPDTAGTAERRLNTDGVVPKRGELAWSPDGKKLAFSGGASIYLLALDDSIAHRVTEPPPLFEDWGPSISSDGQKLLFVRSRETGFAEEILSVPITGGEVTRITSEHAKILGPPQWSYDGQSVIFASDRNSHPALWRVSALGNETPVEINDSGWYPAISHRGFRLAYQRITRSLNIWQIDWSSPEKQKHLLVPSTSETDQGPGPQFSPDGNKLAYMSDRSGTMEIWVSDRDGSNPFQLTAIGAAGTPRWSPDSQAIAFDARARNGSVIYAVNLQDGTPRLLVQDDSENVCPSWSSDGHWIYFASHRTGEWQVWKVSSQGGKAVQVTAHGGHAPLPSLDGKFIFYAKTAYANPEIWQVPVEGGLERLASPLLRPATWASWSVVDQGIVFAGPSGNSNPAISFFDFAGRHATKLGSIDTVPFWLAATRDGKTVAFDQPGWEQAQIMLVENFR